MKGVRAPRAEATLPSPSPVDLATGGDVVGDVGAEEAGEGGFALAEDCGAVVFQGAGGVVEEGFIGIGDDLVEDGGFGGVGGTGLEDCENGGEGFVDDLRSQVGIHAEEVCQIGEGLEVDAGFGECEKVHDCGGATF